jgi:hypothetical protein
MPCKATPLKQRAIQARGRKNPRKKMKKTKRHDPEVSRTPVAADLRMIHKAESSN